jgi:hypothetical protein
LILVDGFFRIAVAGVGFRIAGILRRSEGDGAEEANDRESDAVIGG